MATLITDILDICAHQCGVEIPDSWITASGTAETDLRDMYLPQTVDDVLERVDWPEDIGAQTTISGDGTVEHDLDASFLRMKRDPMAALETTDVLRRPMIPVKNAGDWTYLQEIELNGLDRYFRLKGDVGAFKIDIFPALGTGDSAVLSWVSNSWAEDGAGTGKSEFNDPSDKSRLNRRLLEAGIVWRFRRREGLEYMDVYQEYENLLARYSTDLRGHWPLTQQSRRTKGARPAYPWEITSA